MNCDVTGPLWRHQKAVSCLGWDKSISDTWRLTHTPRCTRLLFYIMSSHHDLWSMFYQFHCYAPCNILFLSDWATMRPYSNMEDDNHGDKSFCVPPYTADVLGKLSINSLTLGRTHFNNIVLNLFHDQFQQHYYWKLTEIWDMCLQMSLMTRKFWVKQFNGRSAIRQETWTKVAQDLTHLIALLALNDFNNLTIFILTYIIEKIYGCNWINFIHKPTNVIISDFIGCE